MENFFLGTINLDISPFEYELIEPFFSSKCIRWSPDMPPENFSFYKCSLWIPQKFGKMIHSVLIYLPHPSTKPEFFQPLNILEIIAPCISNITYDTEVELSSTEDSVLFSKI